MRSLKSVEGTRGGGVQVAGRRLGNCPAHTREAGRGPQDEAASLLEGDRAEDLPSNDICGTSTLVFT